MSQAPTQQGVGGTHTELSGFGLKKSSDEGGQTGTGRGGIMLSNSLSNTKEEKKASLM